jgi:hypothetical protein
LVWTIEIPPGSIDIDLGEGEATLQLHNVCSLFDAFTVPNSFDTHHPLGLVSAVIESLSIHWTGISKKLSFSNGKTFRGDFIQSVAAPISVEVETPSTKPPFTPAAQNGFEFVSDPKTTVTNFAQIGHENNGSLF